MVAIYQTGPNTLVLVVFVDTTIRISSWQIEEERCTRMVGCAYPQETDAAARYVVECARYRLAEVAFQAQVSSC